MTVLGSVFLCSMKQLFRTPVTQRCHTKDHLRPSPPSALQGETTLLSHILFRRRAVKQSVQSHRAIVWRSRVKGRPDTRHQTHAACSACAILRLPLSPGPLSHRFCREQRERGTGAFWLSHLDRKARLFAGYYDANHLSSHLSMWGLYQFLTSSRDCKQ